MKYTNHSNLPEVFVRAVQNDPYNAEGSDITCTTLINPPRIRMLSKRNWDLLEEDVVDVLILQLPVTPFDVLVIPTTEER